MQDLPMTSLSVLEHLIFDDHKNEFVSRKQYEEQYEKFGSCHTCTILKGLASFATNAQMHNHEMHNHIFFHDSIKTPS